MNISRPFIYRPVATTLITIAIALAGAVAFGFLPISPLPQVDFPTINVRAGLPGASPEIMASSVATPLERQLGHIASVTEMTSSSSLGSTTITLQFDLNRDINGAARDVQAAINAARSYLPANLPSNPTYNKSNPGDAPIVILAMTSKTYTRGQMYDMASNILAQRISQISGVGEVDVGGSSRPSVRVELNPSQLDHYGIAISQVANMLRAQNANLAKGQLSNGETTADILANDQMLLAMQYKPLVVGYRNGSAITLSDVADVTDSVQDLRQAGYVNGKPGILLIVRRQPGANIIATVDAIKDTIPELQASIPTGMNLQVVLDRTTTIRQSVHDVERTLIISIMLVIVVVFVFLRDVRATFIPSVVVPVSLIGTFGIMYLCGFSIDNLSLMALTISTGFVVDDAIVVIENITRYIEEGMAPMQAALRGASEIGFTVMSISISLVAVFIPILMMGGIVGRLFREFAVTLSAAIVVSMVVSLTATPMMCSRLLKHRDEQKHGKIYLWSENLFKGMASIYERSLRWVLDAPAFVLAILILTVAVNIYLLIIVPKGFFPQQDNGTIFGGAQGAQDISFQSMSKIMLEFVDRIKSDPAVDNVMAFTGGSNTNGGFIFLGLKPLKERKLSATEIVNRLRPKLLSLPGASAFVQAGQDLRIGGRGSNAQYQYTLQADNVADLVKWGPILAKEMKSLHGFADINSDQQNSGLQAMLVYDRPTASRLGITPQMIDQELYQSFGQAPVSTMYRSLNQYYVVMEVAPAYWQTPEALKNVYVHPANGKPVPLSAIAHLAYNTAALQVNHQGQYPSVTISFNLAPGVALSDASGRLLQLEQSLGMPPTIHGMFSGTLQAFQDSLSSEPILIITAVLAVFIVLGILYESLIHPVTILSTIPSAGVGAVLALMIFKASLDVIGIIGMILLIGIVKKNAILMIDFALAAEREEGMNSRDAIFRACMLRFRPILMTTMAAMLGAMPLALGTGAGSELRRPLGITIVGGLIFSQMLTLYTTPVVYLYMERFRLWVIRIRQGSTVTPRESES
ncbi:acriflavin resistance protein [Candidatus Koribacter versatilis Ellin345]|uniref:Acriflavin resistance protein n=1 Tax=Koribacter versatilis (strain Ellin345) TaxID=204669 RepID=Q1IMR8_KORVE|nr:multidrug efflux RND transporter permease subunit [Candidatus Koribacter versatilis]ABF41832.1 acriflavin resistance protein [Candidatus Koribacter versatilis Ellin345]